VDISACPLFRCPAALLLLLANTLEFDVASIKLAKDYPGQILDSTPGRLRLVSMEPTTMIRNAYHLTWEASLTGFPSWADKDCFDVEAKADEDPAIKLPEARDRNMLRLQSLLVARFNLKFHWETKQQRGYALTVGKKVPTLTPADPAITKRTTQGRGLLRCQSCPLSSLAAFLSNFLKRPVETQTQIQGTYDFNLNFEPLDADISTDTQFPSLFTVLKDQLGLKLEPKTIAVPTMVIDHIDRPTPN